jgi:hypothetical protein
LPKLAMLIRQTVFPFKLLRADSLVFFNVTN